MGPPALVAFRVVQLCLIVAFTYAISHCRTRPGMKPLMNRAWIWLMKLVYLVPMVLYAFDVLTEADARPTDWVSLALSLVGTAIVLKAKLDLAGHHTWSGYALEKPELCTRGIYAVMRHPIYAGGIVFMVGTLFLVLPHHGWDTRIPVLLFAAVMCLHVAISASRESAALRKALGEEYERYFRQVHAVLPIRRYRPEESAQPTEAGRDAAAGRT